MASKPAIRAHDRAASEGGLSKRTVQLVGGSQIKTLEVKVNSNNIVNLTGYVVRDAHFIPASPPVHEGDRGKQAVLYFALGITRMPSKKQDSAVDWPSCVLYGPRAEALQSFLTQGKHVQIVGALRTRKDSNLQSVDGTPTSRTISEIAVEDLTFLSPAPRNEDAPASESVESAEGETAENETELAF